jgi:hypothetical protein
MTTRVSITESKEATFICPKCGQLKTVNVRKFVYSNRTITVNCKCSCGHKWTSVLERRKQLRKIVNLPGTCFYIRRGRVIQGKLKVMDLSAGGMKVKLDMDRKPQVGESLNLEFHLDDKNRTLIKTRVKVRSIKGEYIGTAFESDKDINPDLDFYFKRLFQNHS